MKMYLIVEWVGNWRACGYPDFDRPLHHTESEAMDAIERDGDPESRERYHIIEVEMPPVPEQKRIPPYDPRTTRYDQTYRFSQFTRDYQRGDKDLWFLCADGGTLCPTCVKEPDVFVATRAADNLAPSESLPQEYRQWCIIGAIAVSDMSEQATCDHCGKVAHTEED